MPLADIDAVIGYYLANRPQIDAYLERVNRDADQAQDEWESRHPAPTRAELQARLADKPQRT